MQRRGHCARTSLAVTPACDDAQTSAMRARYGLTPRRVASSRLAAHERREGLAQHAPPVGGAIGVGLGEWPATPAMFCRRRGYSGGNAQGSGWRDGPRRFDGDARNSTRTDNRAAPATLRLHLDVSILLQAQDRYVAKNAFASRPRQLTTLPGRS